MYIGILKKEVLNDRLYGLHYRVKLTLVDQYVFFTTVFIVQHTEYDIHRKNIVLLSAKPHLVLNTALCVKIIHASGRNGGGYERVCAWQCDKLFASLMNIFGNQ